jgi:hypothetical protein
MRRAGVLAVMAAGARKAVAENPDHMHGRLHEGQRLSLPKFSSRRLE